ncbi:MAG: hypothetical protein WBA55_11030, partial [Allopontixanthobacter sediminis]
MGGGAVTKTLPATSDTARFGCEIKRPRSGDAGGLDLHQAGGFLPNTGQAVAIAGTSVLYRRMRSCIIDHILGALTPGMTQLYQFAASSQANLAGWRPIPKTKLPFT